MQQLEAVVDLEPSDRPLGRSAQPRERERTGAPRARPRRRPTRGRRLPAGPPRRSGARASCAYSSPSLARPLEPSQRSRRAAARVLDFGRLSYATSRVSCVFDRVLAITRDRGAGSASDEVALLEDAKVGLGDDERAHRRVPPRRCGRSRTRPGAPSFSAGARRSTRAATTACTVSGTARTPRGRSARAPRAVLQRSSNCRRSIRGGRGVPRRRTGSPRRAGRRPRGARPGASTPSSPSSIRTASSDDRPSSPIVAPGIRGAPHLRDVVRAAPAAPSRVRRRDPRACRGRGRSRRSRSCSSAQWTSSIRNTTPGRSATKIPSRNSTHASWRPSRGTSGCIPWPTSRPRVMPEDLVRSQAARARRPAGRARRSRGAPSAPRRAASTSCPVRTSRHRPVRRVGLRRERSPRSSQNSRRSLVLPTPASPRIVTETRLSLALDTRRRPARAPASRVRDPRRRGGGRPRRADA